MVGLKAPGNFSAVLSVVSPLLPANAPVPSNTDKYCPNPELSVNTETSDRMCGIHVPVSNRSGSDGSTTC